MGVPLFVWPEVTQVRDGGLEGADPVKGFKVEGYQVFNLRPVPRTGGLGFPV
jgi:hypothetical protein